MLVGGATDHLAPQQASFSSYPRSSGSVTAKTTGGKDTTIDLPTKGIVLDVWVDVTTLEATSGTKTIVGLCPPSLVAT